MAIKYLSDKYRKSINPPYRIKDLVILFVTAFILISIPLTTIAVLQSREIATRAAGTAIMSLSPSSQSVTHGTTFSVEIREESGIDPVNAVQANLTYDTNKIVFVSVDTTNSVFEVEAENTGGAGSVRIARGTTTQVTGDKPIATVTFQAKLNTTGSTTVSFDTGTAIVRSTDNKNILNITNPGTYTIVDPPPTVGITSPENNQVVSDTIIVTATANDDLAVTRVEFRVDGGA